MTRTNHQSAAVESVAVNSAGDMCRVPAGTFLMGSDNGGEFEGPQREAWIEEFWIDRTLVTNRQFTQFAAAVDYRTLAERSGRAWGFLDGSYQEIPRLSWIDYATADRLDHPVVLVAWEDALAYAGWAGKRLPTEAEWEKAARGGLVDMMFPWGNEEPDSRRCTYAKSAGRFPGTMPVGSSPPNGYGLLDPVGNAWQWCADWYSEVTPLPGACNSIGAISGQFRARRGGAWNIQQAFRLRCSGRGALAPEKVAPNMGFRCVRSD